MLRIFLLCLALGVAGCEQEERAGESLDEAAEDVRDQARRAKHKVDDALDDVEDELR